MPHSPCAGPPGSQRSRAGISFVRFLSHCTALLPIGVGQAGGQAKHLRLISGENGAWTGPSARALLGGGRDGALLPEEARARSGGWGQHTLPLCEDRFGGLAGSQGEKRATYMSFEPPVKCLTTGKVLSS